MDWEGIVGKEAAKLLRAQMGQILEYLGDPPNLNNVPPGFWDEWGREAQAAMSRHFRDIYLASAEEILNAQPIGVDWGLVNQNAINWAQGYSFDLVTGINETSQRAVADAVSAFFEEQQTIGDLRAALSQTFGPVRASLIADTEVTRAAVQGELAVVNELRLQGVQMIGIWQTNVDEAVCVLCGPLNEKGPDIWMREAPDGPPRHVRCRCWLNHEFVEVAR